MQQQRDGRTGGERMTKISWLAIRAKPGPPAPEAVTRGPEPEAFLGCTATSMADSGASSRLASVLRTPCLSAACLMICVLFIGKCFTFFPSLHSANHLGMLMLGLRLALKFTCLPHACQRGGAWTDNMKFDA